MREKVGRVAKTSTTAINYVYIRQASTDDCCGGNIREVVVVVVVVAVVQLQLLSVSNVGFSSPEDKGEKERESQKSY